MRDFEKTKAEIIRRSEIMKAERKARNRRIAVISAAAAAFAVAVGIIAVAGSHTAQPSAPSHAIENTDTTAPQKIEATETTAPQKIEATETTAPQKIDATETTALREELRDTGGVEEPSGIGSSWICGLHNPAYHGDYGGRGPAFTFFGKFLAEMRGLGETELQEWLDKYPDLECEDDLYPDASVCPYEGKNIVNFIRDFNVTREECEVFFAAHLEDYMLHYYDLDAIFGDDPDAFAEWKNMNYETSRLLVTQDADSCYRLFKFLLVLDHPDAWTSEWLPVATLLVKFGVERADAEKLFDEILAKHYPFKNGCWRIDFDKLYDNLDYYADMLGEDDYTPEELYDGHRFQELYHLAESIDDLYLIKD